MEVWLAFLIAVSPVLLFLSAMFYVTKVHNYLATKLDILLGGRLYDRIDTSLVVDHFCLERQDWLLKGDYARFPKQGGVTMFTIEKERGQYLITHNQSDKFVLNKGRYFDKLNQNWDAAFEVQNHEKFKEILWPDDKIKKLEDYRARN